MSALPPFHVAVPVHDLTAARQFYGGLLGCAEGRTAERWVDFNFYGHQFVAHQTPTATAAEANPVDGRAVPVPHYGVVLPWNDWHSLAEKLRQAEVDFIIEPYLRFEGEVGEQATMFVRDPSGNALEFKSFRDPSQLFAH